MSPTLHPVPAFTEAYVAALKPGDRIVLGNNSSTVFLVVGPVTDSLLPVVREDGGKPSPIGRRRWVEIAKLTPPAEPVSRSSQNAGYGYVAPTIPVPILTAETQPMRCRCGATVKLSDTAGSYGAGFVHESEVELPEGFDRFSSHRIGERSYDVLPRCEHCGGVGHVTYTQHAWYDEWSCARCGGSTGYGIGD